MTDLLEHTTVGNTNFVVFFGPLKISFSKVSNLSREIEYDTIAEGGVNDYVHTFTKGKQQQEVITFEKGISLRGLDDLAMLGLKMGGRIKVPVTIMVVKDVGVVPIPVRTYYFEEGVVTKWEVGDLNALNGEVLIERFSIAHTGLVEVPI